jgi:CheY-like chemotaxis protein
MNGTILLAEDLEDDEALFMRVLRATRLQNPVITVRDGDDAIAYFKGQGIFADREKFPLPAVLFLDLKMPRVSGREVLKWLKANSLFAKMLTIVLTQLDNAKELNEAYALGADSFLTKPFNQADLESLILHFSGYWLRPFSISTPPALSEMKV